MGEIAGTSGAGAAGSSADADPELQQAGEEEERITSAWPTAEDEEALEQTADELRKEMEDAQAELAELVRKQHSQSEELYALRTNVREQVAGLKEDRWKLETYAELEAVKDQLASLQAVEAVVADGAEGGGEAPSEIDWEKMLSQASAGGEMADMEALDAELDREMAQIEAQMKLAQADRLDMEAKREALKREIAELAEATKGIQLESAALELETEELAEAALKDLEGAEDKAAALEMAA